MQSSLRMTITNWKTWFVGSSVVAGGLLAAGLVARALLHRRKTHLAAIRFDPAEASAAVASKGNDPDQGTSHLQGIEEILEHAPPARLA
jgi:hypothetical protein